MSISTVSPPQTTTISSLHTDILESHILTRLDGQTLASVSCTNASLHSMSKKDSLWSDVCHSTWPSTSGEFVNGIISNFSDDCNGHRTFFAQSFPIPTPDPTVMVPTSSLMSPKQYNKLVNFPPCGLISAVDVYYQNKLLFSKTEETETISSWFACSPFRIDLLNPKDIVPTEIPHPENQETCSELLHNMSLSWILINPTSKHSINMSSHKPISVTRHWLTGEVQVKFATILAGGNHRRSSDATAVVRCGIVVNCGRSEKGDMQVRELCMEVEDMDGKHLNGRDSLVILQRSMEGKRGNGVKREIEAKNRVERFEEMKRERRERKLRVEETLDTLSVVFGLSIFAALFFIFC